MKKSLNKQFTLTVNTETEMRLLEQTDAEELFQVVQTNREFLSQWLIWVRSVKSIKDSRKKIQHDQDGFYNGNSLELGIFKNSRLIGRIGFISISGFEAEIGYWLSETENGKGTISLCCKKLIEYAFAETGIHRVVIRMDTENVKSKKIPERLGFTLEGTARASVLVKGEYRDFFHYSLLRTDLID